MSWHSECLEAEQRTVLGQLGAPLARREFYLAGGTAVALRLGHRQSVDLDWFTGVQIAEPMPNMLWEIDWESAKQAIQDWVREIAGT